ncbi:MAG: Tim44 domain-containing protein [Alicycliphilus sp.]|jgi:predicted lipid-binding transport protein (Tim44 family)|nr:Tim44 domain-containing protein [Alicycliphilus sp.]MCA0439011.1 39S ribosomal protein L45 [Pseudomonadota bacterium]
MKLWSVILVAMLSVVHLDADARRMGGGKSIGKQSSNVTQREAAPPAAPAAPMQQNAANSAAPKPAAAPNAAAGAPKKPWGAMLGGLAAGLGLAWLANSLGLGAAFGNFLLIALLALVVMVVIGMVMRARKPAASQTASSPFAFQGAGAPAPVDVQMPRQYNPEKVGNDASARPWEQFSASPQQGGGSMIGSALAGSQNWGVPADFDAEGFLAAAKRNFTTLQAAWDRSDIATLRSMMTDGMLDEIRAQLAEREAQRAGEHPNHTEVVILEAQLLGIEDLGDAYMASVEFSGMIREEPSAGPSPFREVWNMTKPKSGTSGWLVAGLQALQ